MAALEARLREWFDTIDEEDGRIRIAVSHGVAGGVLRRLSCGGDGERPPQDAVFRLFKGVVRRVDDYED